MIILKTVLLFVAFILTGCNFGTDPVEVGQEPKVSSESLSDFSKTYQNIVELQKEFLSAGMEAVEAYLPPEPQAATRSTRGVVDIKSFGDQLPADLSTLKRTVPPSSPARFIRGREVTLKEELDALAAEFNRRLRPLLPDPTAALSLPFIEDAMSVLGEEGLVIGGDVLIPYNSLEGAMQVEMYNAVARGADLKDFSERAEKETAAYYRTQQGSMANTRGMYTLYTKPWPRGTVPYQWGKITSEAKKAATQAIKDWEGKGGRTIRFIRVGNIDWDRYLAQMGVSRSVTISSKKLKRGLKGYATVGAYNNAKMVLNSIYPRDSIYETSLHEMGHVLGLSHEHQRWDRDEVIRVTETGRNYAKIPRLTNDFLGWRETTLELEGKPVTMSLPIAKHQELTRAVGEFDLKSIMLYSGFEIRGTSPKRYTNRVAKISYLDVWAIRRLFTEGTPSETSYTVDWEKFTE